MKTFNKRAKFAIPVFPKSISQRFGESFIIRLTSGLLILLLLIPTFLLGGWTKSAAASLGNMNSSLRQISAPSAEPPLPFTVLPSDNFTAKFTSTILTLNASAANSFTTAVDLFRTPQLPEGFEIAKPVSPATAILFSIGDSFKSFLGFFSTERAAMPAPPPPVPSGSTSFDFDGDHKADAARWRSSSGAWEIKYSGSNTTASGTLASGKLAPADYDGDGKTDLASFNNGTWNIRQSLTGQTVQITGFGQAGDVPVSGNYVGNPNADLVVWRESNGTWYVREVGNGAVTSVQFGQAGDIAVPGNYDGDAVMDYAVFRPLGGVWHILGSSSGYYYSQWGVASDIPVPADFDGDGKTDTAVYRPSSGAWYALKSSAVGQYILETWGNYGDQPAPADYDADGKADFSVYRPTTGVWHTKKSNGGAYEFTALGTPQDTAVSSAYIKQVGGQVASYDLAKTRLSPKNSTGGTDLYSRNFGWSSSLVGLSGRAGLDMGFGISYNSLLWTKHTDPATNNQAMYFDIDNSNISPGFRFGFPAIEPIYYDSQSGKFSYLMVSPSGSRTEFKQIGASDIYETVDSSYIQLRTKNADSPNDPVEDITVTVTGTDGTKTIYNWKGGAFRASEIKDRNGNFITISHDEYGLLQSVTDTLGRVVTVEYDSQLYPTAIKQTWKNNNGTGANVTHFWARFEYTTIAVNPQFVYTLPIYGPTGGAPVKVLSKIKRADDSSTVFEYQQNSFGQVSKIINVAPDNHELNYVQTNLASPGTNLADCPRLSQTKTWAENFNDNQEIVIDNTLQTGHQAADLDGGTVTASLIQVSMQNHPTGNVTNTYVGETGWKESLPIRTDDYANGTGGLELKRSNWTKWTQDNESLSYILNPRSVNTKVSDNVSTIKTETVYRIIPDTTIAEYGLVSEVKVFDNNQTILKKAVTEYDLDPAYVSRRIIGLPAEVRSYGIENGALVLASKATFAYDEENFAQETNQNISPVIQHDNSNFSANFITGRGNPTSTTRHDVTGQTSSVTSKVRYDIAGSTVAQIDPLNRKVRIEYTDVFNDTATSRNTFAYPTKVFDAANNFSEVRYRFDTGANVWAKSPAPAGNTNGRETTRLYDETGRLSKQTLVNTGAYTRYEYPANSVQSKVYSTIIDTNANGADASDEVYAESWTDGAGRTLRSRSEHPNSIGGWTANLVEYDILGQVKRSTVPTEISVSGNTWTPAGDDNRGLDSNSNPIWLWTAAEYDWKGRVTRQINTDGTDKLIGYDGCGCAGGQVTTVQSELVPRDDQPNTTARRTQKIYQDILGRNHKTEVLNWSGSVYTTTIQTFNRRDQVTKTRQYAGAESASNTFQDVSMTYDGHGRMKTRHHPVESAATDTTWIYNADDSVQQVIDPRGVIKNFVYDDPRGLLTNVAYSAPNASMIPVPAAESFTYDNLGNKLTVGDGTGTISYAYNQLSQITLETRTFAGLTGNFSLGYEYQLSGRMKSITDPFNAKITYVNDKTGRISKIEGTGFPNAATYADNIEYRAFGSLKQMNYGTDDNALVSLGYDNRLRVNSYQAASSVAGSGYVQNYTYQYNADSSPQAVNNLIQSGAAHEGYDRTFTYDHLGRLKTNVFGEVAVPNSPPVRPFIQGMEYNAFSNMTNRYNFVWGADNFQEFDAEYVNDRRQSTAEETVTFDAAGRTTKVDFTPAVSPSEHYLTSRFDAGGALVETIERKIRGGYGGMPYIDEIYTTAQSYNALGEKTKSATTDYTYSSRTGTTTDTETLYYVNSSVTGEEITVLNSQGGKLTTNVYYGRARMATQSVTATGEKVFFKHGEPVTGSSMTVQQSGQINNQARKDYEPLGGIVPNTKPSGGEFGVYKHYSDGGNVFAPEYGCEYDGYAMPCETKNQLTAYLDRVATAFNNRIERDAIRRSRAAAATGAAHTAGDRASTGNTHGGGQMNAEQSASSSVGAQDGNADGCTYDANGNPTCAVQSKPWIDSLIDSNSAEFGKDEFFRVPIPSNFEAKINERLGKGDCNAFIGKLVSKAQEIMKKRISSLGNSSWYKITEGQDGYNLVKDGFKQNVFTFEDSPETEDGHGAGGYAKGTLINKNAKIVIAYQRGYAKSSKQQIERFHKFANEKYITTAIHELIHTAGNHGLTDKLLAAAVFELGESDGKVDFDNKDGGNTNAIFNYSGQWDAVLEKHCGEKIK